MKADVVTIAKDGTPGGRSQRLVPHFVKQPIGSRDGLWHERPVSRAPTGAKRIDSHRNSTQQRGKFDSEH